MKQGNSSSGTRKAMSDEPLRVTKYPSPGRSFHDSVSDRRVYPASSSISAVCATVWNAVGHASIYPNSC